MGALWFIYFVMILVAVLWTSWPLLVAQLERLEKIASQKFLMMQCNIMNYNKKKMKNHSLWNSLDIRLETVRCVWNITSCYFVKDWSPIQGVFWFWTYCDHVTEVKWINILHDSYINLVTKCNFQHSESNLFIHYSSAQKLYTHLYSVTTLFYSGSW